MWGIVPETLYIHPPFPSPMRVKAISFDLFGTIISYDLDSDGLAYVEKMAMARSLEMEPQTLLDLWYASSEAATIDRPNDFQTLEDGLTESLSRIFSTHTIDDELDPWVKGLLDFWRSRPLYPEVRETLARLEGHPMCIITNLDEEDMRQILDRTGLVDSVEFALSSEACRCYKPDRRIFREALKRFGGLEPSEVLHVGDALKDDIHGAKSAGLRAAWVNRSGQTIPEGATRPDIAGTDLLEIVNRMEF